ncbi:DnaA regulatory inactivator Hda [Gayadomonas joobiniege]|uniref:DnaA regulatory inactivator Hda n=1 Tax=Gayadomonas joobiniege TaxID=1234606 RepID=UPI000375B596|nr:DnaA regulatory inactivator Hda [Gayadomonas joobiniege]
MKQQQLTIDFKFEIEANFDLFYGKGNELLLASLQAFVASDARTASQQIIYLYGPKGSGKSHLLQAACHLAEQKSLTSQYLPSHYLLQMPLEFTFGLEHNQLIVVDDVDTLKINHTWQAGLFDLINRVIEQGHKIIFAASVPANESGIELPDLISRLNWGQKWRVRPLGDEARMQMLKMRAQARGIPMQEEVASFIINRCQQDNASIMACLNKLDKQSLAKKRRFTIPFVKEVMQW